MTAIPALANAHVLSMLVALLVSALLTRATIDLARRQRWVDAGAGGRSVHQVPVPRLGGVAVSLAALLALAATLLSGALSPADLRLDSRALVGVGIGCATLLGVGIADDIRSVRAAVKLVFQMVAALASLWGGVRPDVLVLGDADLVLGTWASFAVGLVWIVGVTNAMNLIDGLDGLAAGLGLIALIAILVTSAWLGHPGISLTCTALIGALGGFLAYNRHPAHIFLGDSGSLVLGYVLAVLSLVAARRSDGATLALVPLGALAVPLLDACLTITRRWLRGAPLLKGDTRHVHHRLLALGLSHRDAVRTLHAVAAAVAALALVTLRSGADLLLPWSVAAGLLTYGVYRLGYEELADATRSPVVALRAFRRSTRERILLRGLEVALARAHSVPAVRAEVAECAAALGLVAVEIVGGPLPLLTHPGGDAMGAAAGAALVEFVPAGAPTGPPAKLRIWYVPGQTHLALVERLAAVLGPVLLGRSPRGHPAPGPAPVCQVPLLRRASLRCADRLEQADGARSAPHRAVAGDDALHVVPSRHDRGADVRKPPQAAPRPSDAMQ